MTDAEYWQAKLLAKHARVLTQEAPLAKPDVARGWQARVEAHRQALLACTHDGSRTHNDQGDTWCARCGKRMP
jgi:hypothetical protein